MPQPCLVSGVSLASFCFVFCVGQVGETLSDICEDSEHVFDI